MNAAPTLGLPMPGASPSPAATSAPAQVVSLGGLLRMGNVSAALEMDRSSVDETAMQQQNQPVVQMLAGHIKAFFLRAVEAKRPIEEQMLEAMLARRGQYTAAKLATIREQRQPEIYMMVASSKMRQIEALMRDVLIGAGTDKPWTLRPTPMPELPPSVVQMAVQQLTMEIEQSVAMGVPPTMQLAQQRLREMREELMPILHEEAAKRCAAMEMKMEDQLVEGGFMEAMDDLITDLATFKTAFLEGPVIRRVPSLKWGDNDELVVETTLRLHWERRPAFDVYPAPWAKDLNRDPLALRYRLTRADLNELIGVDGYSEASIRKALELFDDRGFRDWLSIDSQVADAEGKNSSDISATGQIDAIRYFGSASGRMLHQWGIDKAQAPDLDKEYQIEAWMVGHLVIKAVLNADPLARRPIYGVSFQKVPGSVWGNSPYDLMRDCQDMCNAAARSLAANLGISSGPQVAILSNRLPSGEDVTEMFPWKIWQFDSDPMGSTAAPIQFFQPQSNAQELMTVYERFSVLADEYTGIPRYMAGFETAGAGRTASGMSMMIGNASKVIKQVLGGVDMLLTQALERLHYYNMRYGDDPALKGDVKIVARGAASLATKEAAQVRTNEFLQATANPFDMQIIGVEGRAELLRHSVKRLDMNGDKVVPPEAVLKQRLAVQNATMMAQTMGGPGAQGAAPQEKPDQEQLQNGAPVSDHFSPQG